MDVNIILRESYEILIDKWIAEIPNEITILLQCEIQYRKEKNAFKGELMANLTPCFFWKYLFVSVYRDVVENLIGFR